MVNRLVVVLPIESSAFELLGELCLGKGSSAVEGIDDVRRLLAIGGKFAPGRLAQSTFIER